MRLEVITSFGTGIPTARLDVIEGECRYTRRVDNNDTFTAVVRWPASITVRTPIRLTNDDGSVAEFRITAIDVAEGSAWATIQAAGPWLSIARGGLIRSVSEGIPTYTFGGKNTISELLTAYVVPNLAADGLDWISGTIGPIEDDALCEVSFTGWNRTQLLQAIVEQTGYEPYLYQAAPSSKYQIAFAVQRGSDATAFTAAGRTNLLRYATAQDDTEIVTAVTPWGDVATGDVERASIAENAWTVSVLDSEWVQFTGDVVPIAFDGQLNGAFLESATTTTPLYREILATRLSDQSIKLASTTGLTAAGQLVRICKDALGNPLTTLTNPEGVSAYEYVHVTEEVSPGRGERNWVQNGGFAAGASGWTPGTSGIAETFAATDTVDILGLKNTTQGAGASTLIVDGFPPYTEVRRLDLLRLEGSVLGSAPSGVGHTIKSDGKATITGITPLAYSVTDGQVLAMEYTVAGVVQQASVTVDGNQSAAAVVLNLKSFATTTRQLTNGDKIQFEYGGTYLGTTNSKVYITNATGSPIVQSIGLPLETNSFSNALLTPNTTDLTAGDTVTISDRAGNTFSATVTADFYFGALTLDVDVTVPASTNLRYSPANPLTITAVKMTTAVKTLTNSTTEFGENGQTTATWSGGLASSFTTANARWMTSGSVLIDYLTIVSGAGLASTSAVLFYAYRAKIEPLASFNNGATGADYLICNATVTLDAAGAGTITLQGSSANSLPDNAAVRLYRNIWGWPSDVPLSNVMRIANGATSAAFPVLLRGTSPRTAWCAVTASVYVPAGTNAFSGKPGPNTNLCPVQFDVNDGVTTHTLSQNIAIPATFLTDERPVPVTFTLKQSFPLTANRLMTVKLSSTDAVPGNPLVHLVMHTAQVVVTSAENDSTPFTNTSHATKLWQRGNRRLVTASMAAAPITGTVVDLSRMPRAQLIAQTIALGQSVTIRDADATQRAMQITMDPRTPALLDISFDRDRPFFESLVVQ